VSDATSLTREAVVSLAAAMSDVFNETGPAGLLARYDDFFTADYRWYPAITAAVEGEAFQGRDGLAAWTRGLGDAWGSFRRTDDQYLAVGDGVLVLGSLSGEGRLSGANVAHEAGSYFRIRGDRFRWGRAWLSHADALAGAAETLRSADA